MTNVILVSFDTTRADRLSCYGHFRRTSPHIDLVAERGVLFTDFFSPHIPTFPGHTTMMTGMDVYAHRVTGQLHNYEPTEGVKMLAELLQERGYYTAAADNLGRWFARGFDHVEPYGWDTADKNHWRKAEAVNGAARKVLADAASQENPFFLFLHYWDPHTPYLPPPPFDRMFYFGDEKDPENTSMDAVWDFENFKYYFNEWMPDVTDIEFPKAQYDAEIAYMDACFAHVLTQLDELGLTGDTLLVLTADHGEELDEHGHWFDHHGLYDTNIHVPLIISCPSLLPEGVKIGGLTQMPDLTPTILDILGLGSVAEEQGMVGKSLLPLIDSPAAAQRGSTDFIHITENTWMKKRGIRTHQWKFIYPLEVPDLHGNSDIELYDLHNDPGELVNLVHERPEVAARFTKQLEDWVAERLSATNSEDPLPLHPIPLRSIGRNMDIAVPRDKRLTKEEEVAEDESLEGGDFIGYEREEKSE